MKIFMKFIIVNISLILVSQAEVIWPAQNDAEMNGKIGVLTENHAKNTIAVLESMPWIEEGNQKGEGKYIYVIYNPNSVASKKLYHQTRSYLDQVNIRWIPVIAMGESVDGLYETRTPEALKDAVTKGEVPKVNNHRSTDLISNMTFTAFIYMRAATVFSPEANSYFPTMIYGDANKLSLDITTANIENIINDIPLTTPNTNNLTMEDLAKREFNLYGVEKYARYLNEGNKLASTFLYPSEDAVRVGSFGYDREPVIISGITDNGYIAVDINGKGNYIYIKYITDKDVLIKPNK